ncbi:MAG: hypothetical protein J5I41_11710, partial [Saprospiraceae bacterium]|nr:hypothetical protein [Saprospiraceae bacterium]
MDHGLQGLAAQVKSAIVETLGPDTDVIEKRGQVPGHLMTGIKENCAPAMVADWLRINHLS